MSVAQCIQHPTSPYLQLNEFYEKQSGNGILIQIIQIIIQLFCLFSIPFKLCLFHADTTRPTACHINGRGWYCEVGLPSILSVPIRRSVGNRTDHMLGGGDHRGIVLIRGITGVDADRLGSGRKWHLWWHHFQRHYLVEVATGEAPCSSNMRNVCMIAQRSSSYFLWICHCEPNDPHIPVHLM